MARGILKSLHGRAFGLGEKNNLYVNQQALGKPANSVVKTSGLQITTIISAQVLALNVTPITIITAPAATQFIMLDRLIIYKAAGTAYLTGSIAATEDLVAKYTDASGAQVSGAIEVTGFLNSSSPTTSYTLGLGGGTVGTTTPAATSVGGILAVAGAAVVLHLTTGEITTGTSDLIVHAYYDVYDHALASA